MQWIFFIEKPVLSVGQFARLSNIFDNAGQVIFGIAVLSPLISGIDNTNFIVLAWGLVTVSMCWILTIRAITHPSR